MSGQTGTIVELDPIDALGWIALDDGTRIRFGGTALKGFTVNPGVGTRVAVHGTTPGYKGVLKAVQVVPLDPPAPAAAPQRPRIAPIPWPTFVREHPRWSDAADTCVPCARPAPRPTLPEHPLFAPWHREIVETAPACVSLAVPAYNRPEPLDPGPADAFAHGRVAFLDEPRWPSCGLCARPLEMCLQLPPAVLADWVPGGRGLAALFCFHCGVRERADPRVGHVRLVEGQHRVTGPEDWKSASSGWLAATQRVTPRSIATLIPSSTWHRYRSERADRLGQPLGAASGALFSFDAGRLGGPFPAGVDGDALDDLGADYDDWLDAQTGPCGWAGARLGGVADWDQADETPSCAHGEMRALLDYDGGQFLDGALHVFACREHACDLAFVAEF